MLLHLEKKNRSFEVKVTTGAKTSSVLSAEGLLKDFMGAAIAPARLTLPGALWLNILHFMLNCLESAELNQVPVVGPKVSSV